MTEQNSSQDEQWLEALAGRANITDGSAMSQQASALRKSLKMKRDQLESQVPVADQVQLEQILSVLRRDGLLVTSSESKTNRWQQLAATVGKFGSTALDSFWRKPAAWGVAATLVVVVGAVVQIQIESTADLEHEVYRGSNVTTLIVEDPFSRANELASALQKAGAEVLVEKLGSDRVGISMLPTLPAMDYLATQRIEPLIQDGKVRILLTKAK